MVEPSTVAQGALAIFRSAKEVAPLLKAYFGGDPETLAELMRKGDAAWVTEVCELLRGKVDVLEERFQQVHPLITSLRWEAARDATEGRRRMLAHLAANLLNSDEAVEIKARVEPTVRDLDPDDIAFLAMIFALDARSFSTWQRHPLRSNLTSCIDVVCASRSRVAKARPAPHALMHDESIRVVDAGRCMASERQDGQGIL